MCICTSVFVSLCTFHMPPHLVFANLHSSPPCHRYCSSIAAGTQRTHRSVAEQQLAGHSCNIYFRLHKNLAQTFCTNIAYLSTFMHKIAQFMQKYFSNISISHPMASSPQCSVADHQSSFEGHLCHKLWKYCFKILMI